MDSAIRKLLFKAKNSTDGQNNLALGQAYHLLLKATETSNAVDLPDSFGQDLYVLCAELAYQAGSKDMAEDCIRMFFLKKPIPNQFLYRAYLCQAQLAALDTNLSLEQLETCIMYILKVVSCARDVKRYHFLVYNASVIYWKICQPFLKSGYRQHLASSLHQIVLALNQTEDSDFEWRAQLLITLVESFMDAHRQIEATHIISLAEPLVRTQVPALYKTLIKLMVKHDLVSSEEMLHEIQSTPEMKMFYYICQLKQLAKPTSGDEVLQAAIPKETIEFLNASEKISIQSMNGALIEENDEVKKKPRVEENMTAEADDTVAFEEKKYTTRLPDEGICVRDEIISILTQMGVISEQQMAVEETSSSGETRTLVSTDVKDVLVLNQNELPHLLLELCHLCFELDFLDLASTCLKAIKQCVVKEASVSLEVEFIECQLMIGHLGKDQESFKKSVVDVRLQAITRCKAALQQSVQLGPPELIQTGCVTLWNLCLPLLQQNLRHMVQKALKLVDESLDQIGSQLYQMRCEVLIELAAICEDKDQVPVAKANLEKALLLDVGHVYQEKLESSLTRLKLTAQLYTQPDRPEDLAAMLIEQSLRAEVGTVQLKRTLLIKVGETLVPDVFLHAVDWQTDVPENCDVNTDVYTKNLADMVVRFVDGIKVAEEHIRRTVEENPIERCRLWADLAKAARKQEIWDVCHAASQLCLLYDNVFRESMETKKDFSEASVPTIPQSSDKDLPTDRQPPRSRQDIEMARMMAEVAFINGEALVQLLRLHHVQLNELPVFPKSNRNFGEEDYVKQEQDADWTTYCNWIKWLSEQATNNFLLAMKHGLQLGEAHLVSNAAIYIWNYNQHILSQGRLVDMVPHLTAIYWGLRHSQPVSGQAVLLVNICTALAQGLNKLWLEELLTKLAKEKPHLTRSSPKILKGKSGKGQRTSVGPAKSKTSSLNLHTDALSDIKQAIDVCEYGLGLASSQDTAVAISQTLPLLQTWVQSKQLAQQQIPRELEFDIKAGPNESLMYKSIVAIEMLYLNKSGLMEFRDIPTLEEILNMMESARWTDRLVELTLYTRFCHLCCDSGLHPLVLRCSKRALKFVAVGTQSRSKKLDGHHRLVEQEMFSYVSLLLGQSLAENMKVKGLVCREALEAFLNCAKFARNAGNYDLVMTAARHFWNACLPWMNSQSGRSNLLEALTTTLDCLLATSGNRKKESADTIKTSGKKQPALQEPKVDDNVEKSAPENHSNRELSPDKKFSDDEALIAAMYGAVVQIHIDKNDWTAALATINKAVAEMPKTHHRILLFKYRILVKTRLGQNVYTDIQRLKDEPEEVVADMWHRAALSSVDRPQQMSAYQAAIEGLESKANSYQKAEYLLEFGQWLYTNQFPLADVEDVLEWASDILWNLFQTQPLTTVQSGGKYGGKKQRGASRVSSGVSQKDGDRQTRKESHKRIPSETLFPQLLSRKSQSQSNKTVASSQQISTASDQELQIDAADYIPVEKVSEIGVLPASPELTLADLQDVRQLETLMRSHIVLAEVTGGHYYRHRNNLLLAHQFLMRLWAVLISNYSGPIKELSKTGASGGKEDTKESATKPVKTSGKKDDKKEKAKEDKPKIKRKSPIDVLPSDLEAWASYDWPDVGLEAFKLDNLKHVAVNFDNFPKPVLTFYYTEKLVEHLKHLGYHHLTLPVLAFQDLLSRSVLKSDALFKLVHLRSLEVCQELNIKSGISYHLAVIGPMSLNIEDLARSHVDMSRYQQQQEQSPPCQSPPLQSPVASQTVNSLHKPVETFCIASKTEVCETQEPFFVIHKDISLREIWTKTAEVLLQQGLYQRAREYLLEAKLSSEAFNDQKLLHKILLLFAKLALYEAQFELAVSLCLKSQETKSGDEQFWYETCLVHSRAVVQKAEGCSVKQKSVEMAMKIIEESKGTLQKVAELYPNRKHVSRFLCAKLQEEYLKLYFNGLLKDGADIDNPLVLQQILTGCQKYEELCEDLKELSCFQECVQVASRHGRILWFLAKHSQDQDLCRVYYYQALEIFKRAKEIAELVFKDAMSLSSFSEIKGLNLPVQRQLADINIKQAEVFTDVFICQETERRQLQLQADRKTSIVQLVQDFVAVPPVYSEQEQQWLDLGRSAADESMACFTSAHGLSQSIPFLRAKCLAGLGRLLRVIAEQHSPEPACQWMVHDMVAYRNLLMEDKPLAQAKELEETEATSQNFGPEEAAPVPDPKPVVVQIPETAVEQDEKTTIRQAKLRKLITSNLAQHEKSKYFYMLASQCLSQCLNVSCQNHLTKFAARASLEMMTLIGQNDTAASSLMLSFYQSCQASLSMEKLLLRCLSDPSSSQLAALLHQRRHMLKSGIRANHSAGPFLTEICNSLAYDWQAWKLLDVSPSLLEQQKNMPSNYIMIVLQHSPERDFLYGALLAKGKASSTGVVAKVKPGGKQTTTVPESIVEEHEEPNRAQIFQQKTNFEQLKQILLKLSAFKEHKQSVLIKREHQKMKAAIKKNLLKTLEETASSEEPISDYEDAKLQQEFCEVIADMESYLQPVLEPICQSLRSEEIQRPGEPHWIPYYAHFFGGRLLNLNRDDASNDADSKDKDHSSKDQQPPRNECVILLADSHLIQLPLEACSFLQQIDGMTSLSRDFSLQCFCLRSYSEKQEYNPVQKADGKKKSKEPMGNSRIQGLREMKQKQVKIIPLDRQPQVWQMATNTHRFGYVVDPCLDVSPGSDSQPVQEFNKILEKYEQQFTSRWLGFLGTDHTPSVGEWELLLTESSAFIFYGMERLLSYLPAHRIPVLNITDCQILFAFDSAQTPKSFQRENKKKVQKRLEVQSVQSPVEMAMLTTCAGVKCVLLNQWHTSLAENGDRINKTMSSLLQKGKTTGQACYLMFYSYKNVLEDILASKKEDMPKPSAKNKNKSNSAMPKPESQGQGLSQQHTSAEASDVDVCKDSAPKHSFNMAPPSSQLFNMVCFGLPNLIVNQDTPHSGVAAEKKSKSG